MPNEFLNLCACRVVNLRREADEIVAEIRCPVQEEAGEGAGEVQEQRAKAPAVRILRQVAEPVTAQVLLEQK